MYRIAVCEDEEQVRQELCALTERILLELDIPGQISTFPDAEALEAALTDRVQSFDLLLLDIQLEGKTGLALAQRLRDMNNRVSIIFISSCREYLSAGYSVQPIHFLIKPVDPKELKKAIQTDWRLNHTSDRIILRDGAHTVVVPIRETAYIESKNHDIILHQANMDLFFRLPLSEVEQLLPKDFFCRCHNSYLVNFSYILEFRRTEIILHTGERIPVGRKYYTDAQNAFIQYFNQ